MLLMNFETKDSTEENSSIFNPNAASDSGIQDDSDIFGKIPMRVEISDSDGNFSSNFKKLEIGLDN